MRRQHGPFCLERLRRFLSDAGMPFPSILMVHASWDHLPHYEGSPLEFLNSLQAILGDSGTLCLPAFPSEEGIESPSYVYDVRRTPSATGLLGEMFRRMPGAVRSAQLRAVASRGPLAKILTADHHRSPYSAGRISPYYRIAEQEGWTLTIGLPPTTSTAFHCGEDVLGVDFPVRIYPREPSEYGVRLADGESIRGRVYRVAPRYAYLCNSAPLVPYFCGLIREQDVCGVPCSLVPAGPFLERLLALTRAGTHVYRLPSWRRSPPRGPAAMSDRRAA